MISKMDSNNLERVPCVCGFALSSAQPSLRPQNAQSNAQKYSNFRKNLMGPPTKRHEKASAVQKLMKQTKKAKVL